MESLSLSTGYASIFHCLGIDIWIPKLSETFGAEYITPSWSNVWVLQGVSFSHALAFCFINPIVTGNVIVDNYVVPSVWDLFVIRTMLGTGKR